MVDREYGSDRRAGWACARSVWLLSRAAVLFALRALRLVRLVRTGLAEDRRADFTRRARYFLVNVFAQRGLLRRPNTFAGAIHAAIFWGFLIVSLGTIQLVGTGLFQGFQLPAVGNDPAYWTLLDLTIAMVLVAVTCATYRRLVLRPYRLTTKPDAWIILGLITMLMVTLLLAEAFAHIAQPTATSTGSLLGNAVGKQLSFVGHGPAEALFGLSWWAHISLVLGFLVYLPSSKHLHILIAPWTILFRSTAPQGALVPIRDLEERDHFGAGKLEQLTWKHLLDSFACTECGRCDRNCPALLSGKPLSPKDVVLEIRRGLFAEADGLLAGRDRMPPARCLWSADGFRTKHCGPAPPVVGASTSVRSASNMCRRLSRCGGTWCSIRRAFQPRCSRYLQTWRRMAIPGRMRGDCATVGRKTLGFRPWRKSRLRASKLRYYTLSVAWDPTTRATSG